MVKSIYQFKITLEEITPIIWRVVEVPSNYTFRKFNKVILAAMGWEGYHLHEFIMNNPKTGHKDKITAEDSLDDALNDPADYVFDHKVKLFQYFSATNNRAIHDYDFGDGWRHDIVLQAELEPELKVKYPRCIAGERACPPEDCGGVPGYEHLMQLRDKPRHSLSSDDQHRRAGLAGLIQKSLV